MARVFITGSTDGLGFMAAELLVKDGHRVTLHARNEQRARDVRARLPQAEAVLIGDASSTIAMRAVADDANASGRFDAVIHNVAIGYREPRRVETSEGIERLFATNVLGPYVLTALMTRPGRLVYLSSGMHRGGEDNLTDPEWKERRWNGSQAYANSKFYDMVLAFAIARKWPDVLSNAVEPGWVATKMGGPGAPDDLALAPVTQAWLAVSEDSAARVSGSNFFHQKKRDAHPATHDAALQEELLAYCAARTGVDLPTFR